ncbi:tyrosine-type recombinase/integrase [Rhodopseudomonas palustris]|uniref:tyrosine-type recombinase/integrase n=1 Tax=Rhodopseudomonas palustris TaxID=1076 RepID=UPI000D22C34A|nr:integrase family protein [Rhodopseudomonas palustris]AVT83691.1 hypothetical protein RPYSC3_48310 [Rhodopseudomonas palustris]
MPNFTDVTVRSLPEGVYFDSKTPSFGIRVGKNRRTWIALKGPNRTKVRLGHYPSLSLSEARKKALVVLGSPFAPSVAPGFQTLRETFLSAKERELRPRSFYQLNRTMRKYFHWTKAVDKITHADVSEVIDAISAKSEASHALKDIKTFFSWCVPRHIPHSPCEGLKPPAKYEPRQRLLSDEEVKKIWRAADQMDSYGALIQMLIVTGQRVGQFIRFDASWIEGDTIRFPQQYMKGKRDHVIAIGPLAAGILPKLRKMTNQGKRKKELDKLSGVTGYTIHDIRRYHSSTSARLHIPIDVEEAILHHVSGSRSQIQRVYDQYDRLDEMRSACAVFELHLNSIIR